MFSNLKTYQPFFTFSANFFIMIPPPFFLFNVVLQSEEDDEEEEKTLFKKNEKSIFCISYSFNKKILMDTTFLPKSLTFYLGLSCFRKQLFNMYSVQLKYRFCDF